MSAERRRAQIIDSARLIFAANGFAATRTRDIAAEAGINEAMLYRHFPSKEELFEVSVLGSIDAAMVRALENAKGIRLDLAGSATEIDVGIRKFFDDLADIAIELGPLIGATAYGPESPVRSQLIERLDALFAVATEITVTGIPDLIHVGMDVRLALEQVFGAMWFSTAMASWTDRTLHRPSMLEQLMETIYAGVIHPPADAPLPRS